MQTNFSTENAKTFDTNLSTSLAVSQNSVLYFLNSTECAGQPTHYKLQGAH